MRASALLALVSMCATLGCLGDASALPTTVSLLRSTGSVTLVHHEGNENIAPAQMLSAFPAYPAPLP
jgi:hypothetical protein